MILIPGTFGSTTTLQPGILMKRCGLCVATCKKWVQAMGLLGPWGLERFRCLAHRRTHWTWGGA